MWGAVRLCRSFSYLMVMLLTSKERLWETFEYFLGGRVPVMDGGFYLRRDIVDHPLGEIVFLHELSHMTRAYNRVGIQSASYFLKKLSKSGIVKEERLANSDEYDHIHALYRSSELPSLREKYPFSPSIAEFHQGKVDVQVVRSIPNFNEEVINWEFIIRLEMAFSMTREEYALKNSDLYEEEQRQNNEIFLRGPYLGRIFFRVINAVFEP